LSLADDALAIIDKITWIATSTEARCGIYCLT